LIFFRSLPSPYWQAEGFLFFFLRSRRARLIFPPRRRPLRSQISSKEHFFVDSSGRAATLLNPFFWKPLSANYPSFAPRPWVSSLLDASPSGSRLAWPCRFSPSPLISERARGHQQPLPPCPPLQPRTAQCWFLPTRGAVNKCSHSFPF